MKIQEATDRAGEPAEELADGGSRWKMTAFEWSGDSSFAATLGLAVYAIFFAGPWQAPVAAAAYWLAVECSLSLYTWCLRREGDRLRAQLAVLRAERADYEKRRLAMHAETLHLRLLTRATKDHISDLRAECERKEARIQEAWIERGRREERARIGIEHAELRANQLELMANQLDIRAEQLDARRTQVKIMKAVHDLQGAFEDKILETYESGFIHGMKRAAFTARSRPRLTVVNSTA